MEIELRNVWYTYDSLNYVLRDLTISFGNGLHLILGPNGSGKTTLLKIASLIYRPTKGEVLIDNRSFWDLNHEERMSIRRYVTYVHEKAMLIRGNVDDNLRLGLKLRDIEDSDALRYFIERYGISHLLKKDARKLSAGEAKLISLIRALVVRPKALLLDEPLTHLDIGKSVLIIEDLVRLVKEGVTVIVATHYLIPELESIVRNVYEIIGGNLHVKS